MQASPRYRDGKRQTQNVLQFSPSIHWIYRWMEPEVLGTPSMASSEFLGYFREENLLMPEGEYKEDYTLQAPGPNERVCYNNHESDPKWMWMYNDLISKFCVCIPFTDFQFTILEQTLVTRSQLHPNHWAMIRGFEIICEYLGVPPSPNVFFYLFTLTCPSSRGLTMGWLSFRAIVNQKVFCLYEESFYNFKPIYFKLFQAPSMTPFWETKEEELTKVNYYWNKYFGAPLIEEDDFMPKEWAVAQFFLQSFEKKHLNVKGIVSVNTEAARKYLGLFTFSFGIFLAFYVYTLLLTSDFFYK